MIILNFIRCSPGHLPTPVLMPLNMGFLLLLRLPIAAIMVNGRVATLTTDVGNRRNMMFVHGAGLGL